ncbi:hypothetical protein [uncultured Williamsia sp.]|uniref:hypothetical protein n=1 Tax=uncultured Williamsia sp. TaxID=259311 RepID=UPI00261A1C31|nr:hypothetical protein [uncultured Williamsia sp.]
MREPTAGARNAPRKRVPISRRRPARRQPEIDPSRPLHIAIAEPWTAFQRGADATDVSWDLPDGIEVGDAVVTLVDAREWAVARVSVWTEMNGEGALHHVGPHLPDGASLEAVERRVAVSIPRRTGTLASSDAAALTAGIRAEADSPTPWRDLDNACDRAHDDDAIQKARLWGCGGCGRDTSRRFAPRFETHVGAHRPDDWSPADSGAVGVCPSCHDILHQPLGPTVEELMFSNRPACPECGEHQAFSILRGFPPGPPPFGTSLRGCDITDMDVTRWVCGVCDTEW